MPFPLRNPENSLGNWQGVKCIQTVVGISKNGQLGAPKGSLSASVNQVLASAWTPL
jgi:hypothetical protein